MHGPDTLRVMTTTQQPTYYRDYLAHQNGRSYTLLCNHCGWSESTRLGTDGRFVEHFDLFAQHYQASHAEPSEPAEPEWTRLVGWKRVQGEAQYYADLSHPSAGPRAVDIRRTETGWTLTYTGIVYRNGRWALYNGVSEWFASWVGATNYLVSRITDRWGWPTNAKPPAWLADEATAEVVQRLERYQAGTVPS